MPEELDIEEGQDLDKPSGIMKAYAIMMYFVILIVIGISFGLAFTQNINYIWLMFINPILAFLPDLFTTIPQCLSRQYRSPGLYSSHKENSEPEQESKINKRDRKCIANCFVLIFLACMMIGEILLYIYVGLGVLGLCIAGLLSWSYASCIRVTHYLDSK